MKFFGALLLGLLFSLSTFAREIDIRLWISGGTRGVVMGSRECPGWLSLARQLQQEDPEACWVHLGAPPLAPDLLKLPGLKFPDALVPRETDFRLQGRSALEQADLPYTLLNVSNLPQFPDYRPAFPSREIWQQPDGVEIHVFGLLSQLTPLRIPPGRLRPLRVEPPLRRLRGFLTENPLPAEAFGVLVLPEDADGGEWSDRFPEFPVLILPPGPQARVLEVREGKQLRVQPARFGRAFIRVQLYWDTVERRFRNPTAEVVWVNAPDLQGMTLPDEVLKHLHPLGEAETPDPGRLLLAHADAVLLPDIRALGIPSRLPDARRVSAVPEDDAWLRVEIPRRVWNHWGTPEGYRRLETDEKKDPLAVLIPAKAAAGNGDWHSPIRQDLLRGDFPAEWMPFSTRSLLDFEENAP